MLGLVADDLTGAGDASVHFARRGWHTFLTLADSWRLPDSLGLADSLGLPDSLRLPDSPTLMSVRGSDPDVIAVTTDCRALSNEAAEKITADTLQGLMSCGVDRVFLKIDSTMRGSVRGQIAGALAAWRMRHRDARVFVCPAYPLMGRTIESGRLLVKGEPVHETAIGRDPVTPVRSSGMAELLPPSPSIHLFDAATDADLMAIAGSISMAGPSVIPVGSGGLAEAVSEVWSGREESIRRIGFERRLLLDAGKTNSRILLQVSSLNPVALAQVARLNAAFPDVMVLLPPAARGDSVATAENLAREFATRLEREQWDVIGFVGGDGARATLRRLGASGIRIAGSVIEGVPHGVIEGGVADQMPVFTKAGGFGTEDALVRCVEMIKR